jgi:PTH1 family peptidyl-tRNA hydrolase
VRAILGIGNPGSRYELNRHNAGFLLLDYFAGLNNVSYKASFGSYYQAVKSFEKNEVVLIKPANYVNNSGIAAKEIVDKYKIELEDLLVICDDINLDLGTLRIRKSGGDGGHNGLGSVIYHLNSNKFPRLRIGVRNKEPQPDMVEFVLSDFSQEEFLTLKKVLETASTLLNEFINGGLNAMLEANSKLVRAAKKNLNNTNEQ